MHVYQVMVCKDIEFVLGCQILMLAFNCNLDVSFFCIF